MLPKAPADVAIAAVDGDYQISGDIPGQIHARVLNGPRFIDRARAPRLAMLIHGGGVGSNHTQVERPGRWLIARELFDQVVLPDRRGHGQSSVLARPMRLEEQADDLRRLLDRMNMYDPLTVLGVDIGGPVALLLASIDPRVNCVALVASAPRRNALSGVAGFLLRAGLLRPLLNREIRRSIAARDPQPVDFDPAYDALRPREMAAVFREAVRSIPAGRLDSLIYASEAEIDPRTSSVPASLRLEIPVLQVIGEVDEAWGDQTSDEIRRQFPNFQRRVVPTAGIHKDVFFKAEAYYQVLFDLLQETCLGVK